MINVQDEPDSNPEAELQREIRQARKFSPQEAIGRLAGPGAMKGGSPISPQQQAANAVEVWIRANVADPDGAFKTVMNRHIKGSALLLENLDRPMSAVAVYCRRILASDQLLSEVVREMDVEWGRAMDERPHFAQEGRPPHPLDPYTSESVRMTLSEVLKRVSS
jgi:hypothetical protein